MQIKITFFNEEEALRKIPFGGFGGGDGTPVAMDADRCERGWGMFNDEVVAALLDQS